MEDNTNSGENVEGESGLEEEEEGTEIEKKVEGVPCTVSVYCLACGDTDLEGVETERLIIKREEGSVGNEEVDLEDKESDEIKEKRDAKRLLKSFCTLLGIKLGGGELEGMSGAQKGYFCLACVNQLELLVDLKDKLEELERDLEKGVEEFRKMCELAEEKFQVGEVYKEGIFYRKIRSQICGGEKFRKSRKLALRRFQRVPIKPEVLPVTTHNLGLVKQEPESLQVTQEQDLLDEPESDSEVASVTSHVSSDYVPPPPKKKTIIKSSKLPPKKRKRPGRPPKKFGNAQTPKPPQQTVPLPKRKRRRLPPVVEDDEFDEEDLETSLKGRMSTDPTTGHTIFLDVLFEALNNGRYRCLTCQKETSYHRGSLKKHVLTIHKSLFVCPECNQRCYSTKSLTSHIRRVHRGEDRQFVECPICGKPCSAKKGRLEKHQATHLSSQEKTEAQARGELIPQWSKLRRHVCEHCGRGYELRSHLIQHKIREHPSDDYTEDQRVACKEMCPDCGKLVHKHYLKKHQEFVHSEGQVKRFSCAQCEKRFVKEGDLRKHKKVVHEKMKPWKCTECPKTFAMKHQLTYHQNNHRNIRPWQCDHCPMGFARKHHLQRHIKIYHEPGANPRRKTYVRGPETKVNKEDGAINEVPEQAPQVPINNQMEWVGNEAT